MYENCNRFFQKEIFLELIVLFLPRRRIVKNRQTILWCKSYFNIMNGTKISIICIFLVKNEKKTHFILVIDIFFVILQSKLRKVKKNYECYTTIFSRELSLN